MIELSIIIVSFNTKSLITKCIKSISSQFGKELKENLVEIIVVDNNSSDGSGAVLDSLKKITNISLIKNSENLGFAKACNQGAKESKGKYVLFLNSDTEVLDRGFFSMTEFLDKNQEVAILGGKLENLDGSEQPSVGKFYNISNLIIMFLGLERIGLLRSSPKKIKKVDWVSGACMMVRKNIFEKLSGFDEKIFMYMEDMEICYRANKIGFFTYFFPNINLKHKSLGSSNKTFAIINIYKGILYFYSKHMSKLEYFVAKSLLVTKAEILILVGFLTMNSNLRETYKKAISFNA